MKNTGGGIWWHPSFYHSILMEEVKKLSSQTPQKSQLVIIFLTVFIYLVGFGIIIPIIPILSRDFGATATQSGLLMSIYSFMQFLFSAFWGKLSDRWGRRPILLFCLFCEGFSYLLFASARSLEMLFVARALAGFFGASLSTASAAISDVTSEQNRSKGMALIGAAFGLGFVFGPAIGGGLAALAESLSVDPFFKTSLASYVVAGICFMNFVFAFFRLKETIKEKRTHSTVSTPWQRLQKIFQNLQVKTLGLVMVIFFLVSMSMSTMEATLILFMGKKFSWGVKEVSLGFFYIGLMLVFTQGFLVRRLLPRWGERKVLRLGLILFFLGMSMISFAPTIYVMAVAMTLLSLGNGLSNPSLLGSVSLLTPSTEQGEKLGLTQSLSSLGRILGPPLGGFLFGHWFIESPFILSSTLALVALIFYFQIFKEIPEHGKVQSLEGASV